MANNKPRLLFYFLHLLGVGHVFRAKRLIEGFAEAGIAVDVIYGGEPVPNITFEAESVHYLPAIRAGDNAYSHYLDCDGNPLDLPFQNLRKEKLLEIFETLSPDLILTEAFPFGRRMVRHELAALFDAARQRPTPPLIVSSVRDILQERKKPGRLEETRDLIKTTFDHILVHSDPEIIKLNETFSLVGEIENKLSYTGFVVPSPAPTIDAEPFDIIVSAGGGAFGGALLTTALQTAISRPENSWCLLTGPNLPEDIADQLRLEAPSNVTIKTTVPNLADHMKLAKVSISQCGYNTAMDALAAHRDSDCRAVFIPYDTEGQTEQLRRAELLEKAGYAVSVPQSELTSENLLEAINRATTLPKNSHQINFEGVKNSASLIRKWIDERS